MLVQDLLARVLQKLLSSFLSKRSRLLIAGFGICLVCFFAGQFYEAPPVASAPPPESALQNELSIPVAQVHPLPALLAAWSHPTELNDHYLESIKQTDWGYPIWSEWPVQVYVAPVSDSANDPAGSFEAIAESTAATQRAQVWHEVVLQAIAEWSEWFPLAIVTEPEQAGIQILRSRPPLQLDQNGQLRPARTAETRLSIHLRTQAGVTTGVPQYTITLGNQQGKTFTLATARHELGHALGLWGHSPDPQDVMYKAQTSQQQPLSVRDLNTLKLLYQQATSLGWPVPSQAKTTKP